MPRFLVILFVLLTGCATHRLSFPKEFSVKIEADSISSDELLECVRRKTSEIRNFRGLLNSVVKKAVGKEKIIQSIVYSKPGKLRIDLLHPHLAHSMGVLVTIDGRVMFVDYDKRKLLVGSDDANAIKAVFGLPFNSDELALWLLGRYAPRESGAKIVIYASDIQNNAYLMRESRYSGIEVQMVVVQNFAEGSCRIDSLEIFDSKNKKNLVRSTFVYDDNEFTLPQRVEFTLESLGIVVEAIYAARELNAAAAPPLELFDIPVPAAFKEENINQFGKKETTAICP